MRQHRHSGTSRHMPQSGRSTSWERVGSWYSESVAAKGHYYHQHVIVPETLRLLGLTAGDSLLDLGCGQGFFSTKIPAGVAYTGIDLAPGLIEYARKHFPASNRTFITGDITKPLPTAKKDFSHAVIILALQNTDNPAAVMANTGMHLKAGGKLVLILNHPCFRIPRQSSWGIDEGNKLQYRRINRYQSPLKIPVTMHPGKGERSPVTWSFHYPLSVISDALTNNGFAITRICEWSSDRESEGSAARMENRARAEIPLFLAIRAQKTSS